MSDIFSLRMLPAREGDCFWLVYGSRESPRQVLIDGGPLASFQTLASSVNGVAASGGRIEVMVITHVDCDHIDGAVKLLNGNAHGVGIGDVWFNGWPQLQLLNASKLGPTSRTRGPMQGSYLEMRIGTGKHAWNGHFGGWPIFVPSTGELPYKDLDGGLRLTLLSPTMDQLRSLRKEWLRAFVKLDTSPGDRDFIAGKLEGDRRYRAARARLLEPAIDSGLADDAANLDSAVANGSSIALLAEFKDVRCALLADAYAPTVAASLKRVAAQRGEPRLRLDLVKLAHHGSRANITTALLNAMECRNFAVSTDGSRFGHPDRDAIELLVNNSPQVQLFFNYLSERNRPWSDQVQQTRRNFKSVFPEEGKVGIDIDLMGLASCRS